MGDLCTFRSGRCACAAALLLGLAIARPAMAEAASPGRIDFASANLPPATVEVDLSQELFADLFGLVDAAVAGIVEALTAAANADDGDEATKLAADKAAEAREIVQLAKEVIHEIRVRVYENVSDESLDVAELFARFDKQLAQGKWENVVKIQDGSDAARVSVLRVDGPIVGAFVVAADGNDVVLANVVGDIAPENVRRLSAAATKIGLELGLQEEIQRNLSERMD